MRSPAPWSPADSARERFGGVSPGRRNLRHVVGIDPVDELSDEHTLVWALVAAAKPALTRREREAIFVTIGSGDNFAAVESTVGRLVDVGVPLARDLIDALHVWLDRYVGHQEEPRLRCLLGQARVASAIRPSGIGRRQ